MPELDELIRASNPWWESPRRIAEDPHLAEFDRSAFRWDPPLLEEIALSRPAIHTLRGPRQVGKTTSLKRLVARLLDSGEHRIGYLSFDLESRPERIVDVIRGMRRHHPDPEGSWILLFDEVTQIPEWQRGVKYAWDSGLIRGDVLVLSGSSARDLLESGELMPARRGPGADYVQLPLSFRSFARSALGLDVDVPALSPIEIASAENLRHARLAALRLEDLDRALLTYLRCGGLPAPIRDVLERGEVQDQSLREIWQAIAGDVTKAGLDRIAAIKLLERVGISLGSTLSWTSAAEAMDATPHTARKYAEFLTLGFSLLPVYLWDLSSNSFNTAKQRKIYFLDPVFSRLAAASRATARIPNDEGLVEGLVAAELFRSLPMGLLETFPLPHAVAYWRATSRREIDFLAAPQAERFPIEVKWSNAANPISNARRAIQASFKKGLVLTRTVLDLEHDVPAIPVSCFLYLAGAVEQRVLV